MWRSPAQSVEGEAASRWRAFLSDAWEKRPGVVRDVYESDDGEMLFDSLCRAREETSNTAQFTLWIDYREVDLSAECLPVQGDAGLVGYLNRLREVSRGREITLLLANPHLFSAELRDKATWLVDSTVANTGMPCGGVDTGLFLGCYRRTPFGVHRGQMSVVTLPVVGSKRFLLWDHDYGVSHADIQDSLDYDDHRDAAIECVAKPGDLLYWPADHWHIAESAASEPAISAAWNVGFWWDRPALARVLQLLSHALALDTDSDDHLARHFDWAAASDAVDGMPSWTALDHLRAFLSGGGIDAAVISEWLRFVSANGFRDVPALSDTPVPQRPLRLKNTLFVYPLASASGVCVAANGHSSVFEGIDAHRLAELRTLGPGDLIPARGTAADGIVTFLWNAGALETEDRGGS